MRGNRALCCRARTGRGSIPAHAGKPPAHTRESAGEGVYPRACGETRSSGSKQTHCKGLSPRMRGNPEGSDAPAPGSGSIPAHAGKPRWRPSGRSPTRVYPRACGETLVSLVLIHALRGLSPRMRGNRGEDGTTTLEDGSIPAHAGKPWPRPGSPAPSRVYPRACGETTYTNIEHQGIEGLSPRMRGNPAPRPPQQHRVGSIPAHAGKPGYAQLHKTSLRVYPRACGETRNAETRRRQIQGLSPRMRGNQLCLHGLALV